MELVKNTDLVFEEFRMLFMDNFNKFVEDQSYLYIANTDKDTLWNTYLDSFPPGTNEVYLTRREYDCQCCKHFIRDMGNVVSIKNGILKTIWGFDSGSFTFQPVLDALDAYVKSCEVRDVRVDNRKMVGVDKSGGFYHFYVEIPRNLIAPVENRDVQTKQAEYRDSRNVFKRSLDEFTLEGIDTVLEIIYQGSLYRGEEWKTILEAFREVKRQYDALPDDKARELYAWERSVKQNQAVNRIRNHSIGTLLIDVCTDVDLDESVRKYESIVAPSNYKRPKAIYTKRMLEEARQQIESMGYIESLGRRHATIEDITVNNILFTNKDTLSKMKPGNVFEAMAANIPVDAKKFSRTEEISIRQFVDNILPTAREVEVMVENKHAGNFMSLIAPVNADAPSMFKWGNAFSWAYAGNIADSMKERVKAAGGKVDGDLRFSIQWNDFDDYDGNDVDAHCRTPTHHIYYGSRIDRATNGNLDVDIIHPKVGTPAVENITWPDRRSMRDGVYKFMVHCYSFRGGRSGFRAEIEFDGSVYSFDNPGPLTNDRMYPVADVVLKNGEFTMKPIMKSTAASREIWGIKTQQFVPVSTIMYSPNYWDEQDGIGNKHYFFILNGCKNPERPNGFYNEYLKNDLVNHRRVFEALGSQLKVEQSDDQLSGIGFSSTQHAELIVKVKGQTERVLKVKI